MQSVYYTSIRIPRRFVRAKHIVKPGFRPRRNKGLWQRVRLDAVPLNKKPAEIDCDCEAVEFVFERRYPKTKAQSCRQRVSLRVIDVRDFRPKV